MQVDTALDLPGLSFNVTGPLQPGKYFRCTEFWISKAQRSQTELLYADLGLEYTNRLSLTVDVLRACIYSLTLIRLRHDARWRCDAFGPSTLLMPIHVLGGLASMGGHPSHTSYPGELEWCLRCGRLCDALTRSLMPQIVIFGHASGITKLRLTLQAKRKPSYTGRVELTMCTTHSGTQRHRSPHVQLARRRTRLM